MLDLENAIDGFKQIHVWRGDSGPWMHIVAVEFGEPIDPQAELAKAGIPQSFTESTNMQYSGIMPLDEVQQRLDLLRTYAEN